MRYHRRSISRRSGSNSYFTTCKWCGERIHMREMPYGQWVAFGSYDSVHECGQMSDFEIATSARFGGSHFPASSPAAASLAQAKRSASQGNAMPKHEKIASQPPPYKEMPAWLEWLLSWVVIAVVIYLFVHFFV